jgi:5-methylcytosine-specific restriction endonuclease McrA
MSEQTILKNWLKSKNKINEYNEGKEILAFAVQGTFRQIYELLKNKKENNFETPTFQADLDEDKIDEMVQSYLEYPSHFVSQLLLTIANVKIGNDEINYIMDGQHRMEMIKKLYENYKTNENVIIAVHFLKTEDDLLKLFNNLNKDSTKNLKYVKLDIFKKHEIVQFRTLISMRYQERYAKTKSKSVYIKTVNEFIEELHDKKFFEKNKLSLDETIKLIDSKHIEYFNELQYLENVGNNPSAFYKDEVNVINKHKNVMFLKNNNFVDFISCDELPNHHTYKEKRCSISHGKRCEVWDNEFCDVVKGVCPVIDCTQMLYKKDKGFQCGHIISVKNGGSNELDNLRPICANCNSKMSSTNWTIYEFKSGFEKRVDNKKEIDGENSDDHEFIDCDRCCKSLTKLQCKLTKIDNKMEIVCAKCSIRFQHKKISKNQ